MAEHDAKLLKNRIALSEEIRKKQGVFNKMDAYGAFIDLICDLRGLECIRVSAFQL